MVQRRPGKILRALRGESATKSFVFPNSDPFETLIKTIISQNTADRNTARAFENLSNQFDITSEVLAKAKISQIETCLKVAGLHRNKARTIKNVSRKILQEYQGRLEPVLSLPLEEARKRLLQLPGVGPKTTDVLLLFCARKPVIPVDTHVNRVAKRLGLAPCDGDYEAVRNSLQASYDPKDCLAVHVLFISHGRTYCKARTTLCIDCPLNAYCPSRHARDRNG